MFFFLMIRRPPRSTPFPTRRSSDLELVQVAAALREPLDRQERGLGVLRREGFSDVEDQLRVGDAQDLQDVVELEDRKSTRLNSSHANISYAVFCLKKNKHYIPSSTY